MEQPEDNQFGEPNHYQANSRDAAGQLQLEAEYATGTLDTPHRIVLAPIFELPFGDGKKWANGAVADAIVAAGSLSAVAALKAASHSTRYTQGFRRGSRKLWTVELRPNVGSGDPNTRVRGKDRVRGTPWGERGGVSPDPQWVSWARWSGRHAAPEPVPEESRLRCEQVIPHGWLNARGGRFEVLNATNSPKLP